MRMKMLKPIGATWVRALITVKPEGAEAGKGRLSRKGRGGRGDTNGKMVKPVDGRRTDLLGRVS